MVEATQLLETLEDVIDSLGGPLRSNTRWMRRNGIVNIRDGRWVYKMVPKNRCGAEMWRRVWQFFDQGSPPYFIDCDMASCILAASLISSGEDPKAGLRAIQIEDTAHIQVVSRKKILDPSVWLGMPVPRELQKAIYDLNFKGAVYS